MLPIYDQNRSWDASKLLSLAKQIEEGMAWGTILSMHTPERIQLETASTELEQAILLASFGSEKAREVCHIAEQKLLESIKRLHDFVLACCDGDTKILRDAGFHFSN